MRALFYFKRRYQHRTRADKRIIAYSCLQYLLAVKIGRYRTCADIGIFTDFRIAEIAMVSYPNAFGKSSVFKLGKYAEYHIVAKHSSVS